MNSERIISVEKSGAISKHEREYKKALKYQDSLQNLMPIFHNAKKQQTELKNLEKEFKKMNLESKKIQEEVEEIFTQKVETKSMYEKSNTLIPNVNELCRKYNTLKQLKNEFEIEKKKIT